MRSKETLVVVSFDESVWFKELVNAPLHLNNPGSAGFQIKRASVAQPVVCLLLGVLDPKPQTLGNKPKPWQPCRPLSCGTLQNFSLA